VTTLTINRLAPREVTALIDRVAGDRSIVNALRRDMANARADELVALADEKGALF
jgi:hypothetical protein